VGGGVGEEVLVGGGGGVEEVVDCGLGLGLMFGCVGFRVGGPGGGGVSLLLGGRVVEGGYGWVGVGASAMP
jgi:hypothetical protein